MNWLTTKSGYCLVAWGNEGRMFGEMIRCLLIDSFHLVSWKDVDQKYRITKLQYCEAELVGTLTRFLDGQKK